MKSKGQLTVIGVISIFITIILVAILTPVITDVLTTADSCVTGNTSTVLNLIPLFLFLGVIIGIIIYATGNKQPQYAQY